MSPETQQIVQLLKTKHIANETVTYAEINELVKANVQYRKRHWLASALKSLEKNEGLYFRCIPNVGYMPLQDSDLVKDTTRLGKVKRHADRRSLELKSISFTNINDDELRQYTLDVAKLGIIELGITLESKNLEGDNHQIKLVKDDSLSSFRAYLVGADE